MRKIFFKLILLVAEPFLLFFLLVIAFSARFIPKKIDVGLGPLPLINAKYHKKVFEKCGYSAETYVHEVWFITEDFDMRFDKSWMARIPVIGAKANIVKMFIWSIFRYRCLLIYFQGASLGMLGSTILWRFEPFLLMLANVKTVVMAYGSDVQAMSRSPNLLFKDAVSKDYPTHANNHYLIVKKIDLWTRYATHVVGGCEWVDYMHHWEPLMVSHFSVDMNEFQGVRKNIESFETAGFKILHAPNHRNIKGTSHIIETVDELNKEGLDIELILAERLSNQEVKEKILESDVVIDQLIIGWYAMFAIEAMALKKPVVCYLRDDLIKLYRGAGFYDNAEDIPLINSDIFNLKETLRDLYVRKDKLEKIGQHGHDYVEKHHSIEAVAKTFSKFMADVLPR